MTPGGLFILFDEQRRATLIQDWGVGSFSDTLSIPDWGPQKRELALLSFGGNSIDYVALMSRGKRVATAKSKVTFAELIDLDQIPVAQIQDAGVSLSQHLIRSSHGVGGRVPDETWNRTLAAIKRLRPNLEASIERIEAMATAAGDVEDGPQADLWVQEREALGAALEIFGGQSLRSEVLRGWDPKRATSEKGAALGSDGPIPLLRGLSPQHLNEESALQHDLMNWVGATAGHIAGVSTFRQGKRELSIIYANSNPLERTLGVDLIYHNSMYAAFVLVQYKLMTTKYGQYSYRPDKQFADELRRMEQFLREHQSDTGIRVHNDERLNPDGFFVKFVPNEGVQPRSGELIRGKYVTRAYAEFLIGPNGPKGPRGGSLLTLNDVERALSNTEFTSLVGGAWVGTRGVQTSALSDLIRGFYETGHCVYVAHERKI